MPSLTITRKNGSAFECLFDEEDAELVNQSTWHISQGYAVRALDSKPIHRVVMNVTDPMIIVDHINNNRMDNRRINLRIISRRLNAQNRTKKLNCSSQFIGVSWATSKKKWVSACNTGNRKNMSEQYDIEEHAAFAYNLMAKETLGPDAKINEISKPDNFIRHTRTFRKYDHHLHHIKFRYNSYHVLIQKVGYDVYNKSFKTEHEAILNRDGELKKREVEREANIRSVPIHRNNDGIAIISCSFKNAKEVIYSLVDDEDYYSIMLASALETTPNGYVKMRRQGKLLHRWLLSDKLKEHEDESVVVDHIDGNRRNNQRANLRIVSQAINSRNTRKRKGSSSKYLGVIKRGDKFKAHIKISHKQIRLGVYLTEELAAAARDHYIQENALEGFNLNNVEIPIGFQYTAKKLRKI